MDIRFYAEYGIYILQVRSLHNLSRSLVFMNDITPTHSVRCESTAEFPKKNVFIYFFCVALRPNVGHGLLNLEVSRSHTTTHHSR